MSALRLLPPSRHPFDLCPARLWQRYPPSIPNTHTHTLALPASLPAPSLHLPNNQALRPAPSCTTSSTATCARESPASSSCRPLSPPRTPPAVMASLLATQLDPAALAQAHPSHTSEPGLWSSQSATDLGCLARVTTKVITRHCDPRKKACHSYLALEASGLY